MRFSRFRSVTVTLRRSIDLARSNDDNRLSRSSFIIAMALALARRSRDVARTTREIREHRVSATLARWTLAKCRPKAIRIEV